MRKVLVLLIAFAIALVAFSGCNAEKVPETRDDTAESTANGITYPEETEQAEEKDTRQKDYVELAVTKPFSEDRAWVQYWGGKNEMYYGLLKTDGEIITNEAMDRLYTYDHSYMYVVPTEFSGGYSYVNIVDAEGQGHRKNKFLVFDRDGNVVLESPDDGTGYRILTGGEGVFFVHQQKKSMTENAEYYGVIGVDGTWILELTAENPLKFAPGDYVDFYYFGEHMFGACKGNFDKEVAFYNLDTGAKGTFYKGEYGPDESIWITNAAGEPFQFVNGKTLVILENSVYTVDRNCNFEEIVDTNSGLGSSQVMYCNGGFFYGHQKTPGWPELENWSLYDLNGKKLLDFSDYSLVSEAKKFYEFNDGVALLCIDGADGDRYVGYIDEGGNFLHEPIAVKHYNGDYAHGYGSSEAIYIEPLYEVDGRYILMPDGQLTKVSDEVGYWTDRFKSCFSCGYTCCTIEWKYEEYVYYIGTDGKYLDTYILTEGRNEANIDIAPDSGTAIAGLLQEKDPLIGTWVWQEDNGAQLMTFQEDGGGAFTVYWNGELENTAAMTWKKEGEKLAITIPEADVDTTCGYMVDDEQLTLDIEEYGKYAVLKRLQ